MWWPHTFTLMFYHPITGSSQRSLMLNSKTQSINLSIYFCNGLGVHVTSHHNNTQTLKNALDHWAKWKIQCTCLYKGSL